jgi:hypothetical protein
MKLAITMLLISSVYLILRAADVFPHHSHASLYFAGVMTILTSLNLWREWRDYHES